ncbi:MAG: PA domain-containing protein, partial [Pseudonocardiaceae bacterium]
MDNQHFRGDLLVHQNETCDAAQIVDPTKAGGISLWNVADPRDPQPIKLHTGDVTTPSGASRQAPTTVHSMRVWFNAYDRRTYVVLVDNEELTDVDIMDITDPYHPVMVNDTLDLAHVFGVNQPSPSSLTSVFSHDMMVQKVGQRYVMNMNYWDGGYVLLDVTDPRPGRVTLIAESDYAALDEERLARGHEISPEGNGHQSELSPNRKYMIGTDEDFNAFRVNATIDSGPYAGTGYIAVQASATPPIGGSTVISGSATHVGLACGPVPAGTGPALIERGVCTFQDKLNNITAAGYTAGIVFNNVRADCMSRSRMTAAGTIPYVFVSRLTGLQLLGVPGVTEANACTTATPSGATGNTTTIRGIFDGWGYVRLFATDIPHQRGKAGSIRQIDTYAVPEAQDEAHGFGFGALSVHEVAMDPDNSEIAYISYYAAGFRVVHYGKNGIDEVGA